MKKLLSGILLSLVLTTSVAFADGVTININGVSQDFPIDSKPYISAEGRTMVPIRFISEKLGAIVTWNDGLVEISKDTTRRIVLKVGEKWSIINILGVSDSKKDLDASVVLKNGRTFAPLRFVSESLENKVEWDGNSKTVRVFTKDYIAPTVTPTPTPQPDHGTVVPREIADPATLPKLYFNKVSETGTRPEGFVEPKFYAKVVNNYTEYFTVYLENALDYKDIAEDITYKVEFVDYPTVDVAANIFTNEITLIGEKRLSDGIVKTQAMVFDTTIKSNDKLMRNFLKREISADNIKLYDGIKIKTKVIFKYKEFYQEYIVDVVIDKIEDYNK